MRTTAFVLPSLVLLIAWPSLVSAQVQVFESCETPGVFVNAGTAADNPNLFVGPIELVCDDTRVFADELELDADGLLIHLRGNVTLAQQDLLVFASEAELDRRTRLGAFADARGYARLADEPAERSPLGTMENDVFFWGDRIDRTGPRTYQISTGCFTSCLQPTPRWDICGTRSTVTLDERVVLRHAVLRVKGVPLLYVPVMFYPLGDDDRSTGFLLPTYSTSTVRGAGLSNAFFLTLGRSQDATFYHDWFSRTGQGFGAEYRYAAAPDSAGRTRVYVLAERDVVSAAGSTLLTPAQRSVDVDGQIAQALGRGVRLVGRADYFTNATTSRLYNQNVLEFSRRERYLGATMTGALGRYRLAATVEQRDNYRDDVTRRLGRTPIVEGSVGDTPIGSSAVYVGASGQAAYLLLQDDLAQADTNRSLWRFDAAPRLRAPLSTLPFLRATASASWRVTHWLEQIDPVSDLQVPSSLTRHLFQLRADLTGPILGRVFQTPTLGYAERFKHTIEPTLSLEWLSPFDARNHVVKIDGIDQLVGGTTQITYGVTNQLLARQRAPTGTGPVRQILTARIAQTYYSNALAAAQDARYQTSGTGSFSPVQISVDLRPTDRLEGRFRMDIDPVYRTPRTFGASGVWRTTWTELVASWAKRQYIPGLEGFEESRATHYFSPTLALRTRDNRLGGTYRANVDLQHRTLLQQQIVAYYNAQCCGLTVDYQTIGQGRFGSVPAPADRRVGVSFTLAGIGSFSNPLGSFGQ